MNPPDEVYGGSFLGVHDDLFKQMRNSVAFFKQFF